ncbi:hypothetical protein AN958_01456, partial [Leucoagaricus sp. SymC.cos]
AGNKRSWEGTDLTDSAKRHRPKDDPRDWRDVYLRSPTHRSVRRDGLDDKRDHRRDNRRRSRDRDNRRDDYRRGEYSRDRSRRDRDHSRRRDDYASRRSASPRPNGHSRPQPVDDEREEGEISPRPSPPPPTRSKPTQPAKPADEELPKKPEPEPEMELEIPATPPPVEDLIAARRAKRQAILAKYSGLASANASPSPIPPNSAEPPPESPAVSRSVSQPQDVAEAETPVQKDGEPSLAMNYFPTHARTQINEILRQGRQNHPTLLSLKPRKTIRRVLTMEATVIMTKSWQLTMTLA